MSRRAVGVLLCVTIMTFAAHPFAGPAEETGDTELERAKSRYARAVEEADVDLEHARKTHAEEVRRAREKLSKAYDDAIRRAERRRDGAAANRLREAGKRLEGGDGPLAGKDTASRLAWTPIPEGGRIVEGFKIAGLPPGHEEETVLNFIIEGRMDGTVDGKGYVRAVPDPSNVLHDKDIQHGHATYFVFHIFSVTKAQKISLDLQIAGDGELKAYVFPAYLSTRLRGGQLAPIGEMRSGGKGKDHGEFQATLKRGKYVIILRYINHWADRWINLGILGEGLLMGHRPPE